MTQTGQDPSIAQPFPIAGKNRAETFAESDVTLGLTNTTVTAEAVALQNATTKTTTTPDLGSTNGNTAWYGMLFVPNVDLASVTGHIDSNTGTVTQARIYDADAGTLVDSITGTWTGGDDVTISATLSAGTTYALEVRDGGNSYTRTFESGGFSPPYEGAHLDVIDGSNNGASDGDRGNIFDDITGTAEAKTSGSVTVEWPDPPDVYRWDAATFQFTDDGETVDVYIQEDDGSGWSDIAGPIDRGADITADPANPCRFRVELSRADTAKTPTLDAVVRRYIL